MGVESKLTGIPQFEDFEIIKSGFITVSHPANTDQAVESISHNLGFVPAYLLFVDVDSLFYSAPLSSYFTDGANAGKLDTFYDAYATNTDFTCRITTANTGGSYTIAFDITFKYFLLRNTAKSS